CRQRQQDHQRQIQHTDAEAQAKTRQQRRLQEEQRWFTHEEARLYKCSWPPIRRPTNLKIGCPGRVSAALGQQLVKNTTVVEMLGGDIVPAAQYLVRVDQAYRCKLRLGGFNHFRMVHTVVVAGQQLLDVLAVLEFEEGLGLLT